MNASTIIKEDMTLEEKLAAIDAAIKAAQATAENRVNTNGMSSAPLDPASLTICDGCE